MPNNRGFTLIELSIVLVIIGLIVGGVLVGRDLIHAAEIRAQVSQIEKFGTAVNTFRLKYNALPGDMPNSNSMGLGTGCLTTGNGTPNGNGDGKLTYDVGGATPAEDRKVFCHLYNANLWPAHQSVGGPLSGCYDGTCTATSSALPNVVFRSTGAYAGMSAASGMASSVYFFLMANTGQAVTALDAAAIDTKLDDALPLTGSVRGWASGGYGATSSGAAGSANCVNNDVTPNVYNTSYTAATICNPGFKITGYE